MLDNKEYIKKFEKMQNSTIRVTRAVAEKIQPGMSELDVADLYTKLLEEVGLKDHWYPILVYAGELTGKTISRKSHLPSPDVIIKENDIIILDATPIDKTVWSNWAETFLIGKNSFFESLVENTRSIVDETYSFAIADAKTIGNIYDYCVSKVKHYELKLLDYRNDVGHSIFQVPQGQTVDKTPVIDRLFINEDYRDSAITGIISIEPQLGRVNPEDGKMYGAKIQKVIIKPL